MHMHATDVWPMLHDTANLHRSIPGMQWSRDGLYGLDQYFLGVRLTLHTCKSLKKHQDMLSQTSSFQAPALQLA